MSHQAPETERFFRGVNSVIDAIGPLVVIAFGLLLAFIVIMLVATGVDAAKNGPSACEKRAHAAVANNQGTQEEYLRLMAACD